MPSSGHFLLYSCVPSCTPILYLETTRADLGELYGILLCQKTLWSHIVCANDEVLKELGILQNSKKEISIQDDLFVFVIIIFT